MTVATKIKELQEKQDYFESKVKEWPDWKKQFTSYVPRYAITSLQKASSNSKSEKQAK